MQVVGNLAQTVSFLLLGPSPLLAFIPQQFWMFFVSLPIFGIANALVFMPSFAVLGNACKNAGFPNDVDTYGIISGYFLSVFSFGNFLGPILGGALEESLGFPWATTLISAGPVLSTIPLLIYFAPCFR